MQVAPGVEGAGHAGGVKRNLSVMSVALTSLGRRWPVRPRIVKLWFIYGWGVGCGVGSKMVNEQRLRNSRGTYELWYGGQGRCENDMRN